MKALFDYYSDFNFKNITSKKYRHLFLLLFWPVYLTLFLLTEKYVTPSYNVYCGLDDLIPFCEFFVIPYVLWYALLAFVSVYTLLFDVPSFKKFYVFLSVASIITFAIYILFPNMQNLRPTEFPRDNFLVDAMKNLYEIDTNTNVCPSIHVVFSIGMLFALWNSKHFGSAAWRTVWIIVTVLICIATVFLKQHSVIDILFGVLLSAAIFPFVFLDSRGKNKKLKKE